MATYFYFIVFAVSLICTAIYIYMWHKHFDVNLTLVFTIVPVSCLGYYLYSMSESQEGAETAMKICYIGGCFLQFFMLFGILNLCHISIKKWIRPLLFVVCMVFYASTLTIGHLDIYYKNSSFKIVDGSGYLNREYGFMHSFFYVAISVFFAAGITAIIYSWFKKSQISRTIILLLVIPYVLTFITFFIGRRLISRIDMVPLGYALAEIVYLLIAYRLNLYDVSETVIDSLVQEETIGYISFDFSFRYLGSNDFAKNLIPELKETAVDEIFGYRPSQRKIRHFLNSFKENPENNSFVYTDRNEETGEERIFNVNVSYLYGGNRRYGYIVTFRDDTANKKYIRLLDEYNENLQNEVAEKTRHIIEMHDNLIMSLAMMVESRDNSTGGHIKRTSEGVRILIDEISKEGVLSLDEKFCKDIIKAAPMHDLGKIAVDDAVLRKPGRFTPEEYDKMKHHAAEGARVIHEILLNTDDESFRKVAENVAHYHHERFDGSGYPEGLSGENIPLEARIMAIADVYDALVSKRVYKEAFGFEKADSIIMEGMGTQFDPGLKSAYEHARPRLEEYYGSIG